MEKVLDIDLEDKFKVKLGLIFTGSIDVKFYGKIVAGYGLDFIIEDKSFKRKILGVEYFRPPHYIDYNDLKERHVGLLMELNSEDELNQILTMKSIRQTAKIYKEYK